MRRKFLAPALVFIMCIGITMTAYASPQADQLQNQPQFTTNPELFREQYLNW